jgi:hypothetical protein
LTDSNVFPSVRGLSEREVEKLYSVYAKSFGDCEAPKDVSAHHGFWELVGQRRATNSYCGTFQKIKICPRVELHANSTLDGVSHAGEVFVRKIHRSCNSPLCSVCVLSGWAKRLADHATQRIEVASKKFGLPQHIIVSPPQSDWGLFEFENEKFRLKIKKLLYSLGVVGGCMLNHGFSYYSYQESLEKGGLWGWNWHPHIHVVGFILGYSKCRHCPKLSHAGVYSCAGCFGFEAKVRRSYEQSKTIVKVKNERATVFGTIWYAANHAALPVREVSK